MAYILDKMTSQPIAVYALRKLVSTYTGSAIRVRRSNDNVERDIGFTVNDDLDTTTLSSFIGSNSGLVTVMYDQKGSYNAVQSTAGNQPRIVNSGTIDVDSSSGKPSINYVTNDRLVITDVNNLDFGTGNFTINSISRPTTLSSGNYSIITKRPNTGDTEPGWSIKYTAAGNIQLYYTNSNDNNISTVSIDNTYILDYVINSNSQILYKNGNLVSSKSATSANVSNGNDMFIGRAQTGEYLVGYVHEVLIFNTALSDTDRRYLETNQGDYYSITVADPLYPNVSIDIPTTEVIIPIVAYTPVITATKSAVIQSPTNIINIDTYTPTINSSTNINAGTTSDIVNINNYNPLVSSTMNQNIDTNSDIIDIVDYTPIITVAENMNISNIIEILDIQSYIPTIETSNNVSILSPTAIININDYNPVITATDNNFYPNTQIINVEGYSPFIINKQNVMENILSAIVNMENYIPDVNTSTNSTINPNIEIVDVITHVPTITCIQNIYISLDINTIDMDTYSPVIKNACCIGIAVASAIMDISGGSATVSVTTNININVKGHIIRIKPYSSLGIIAFDPKPNPIDNVYSIAASRSSATYGNVASALRETIIAKFPYDFFKYINISTELAFRNMKRQFGSNTNIEIAKRKKPYLVINPSFNLPGSDMFLYETPLTKNFQNIEYGISTGALFPIINDLENKVKFMYKLNRDKIDFEVTITVSTVHQQIDIYKAILNVFTWDNPIYTNVSLEAVLPKSFITFFGKLIGIDITDTESNNIPILLQKLNSNSQYPITYKMRNASSLDEFYMYYNHKVLTTYSDLSLDRGNRKNMADDNFNITFNVSMEFNLPGLFVIMGAEPRYELDVAFNVEDYGSNYTEFIPIYTFNNLYNDYMSRVDGYRLYTSSIFTTNKDALGADTLDISPIFEQNYIDIINEYLSLANPVETIVRLLIIKDRTELREEKDWTIDWSTLIVSITNLDSTSTYRLLVYVDGIRINERLAEIEDTERFDKTKNIL